MCVAEEETVAPVEESSKSETPSRLSERKGRGGRSRSKQVEEEAKGKEEVEEKGESSTTRRGRRSKPEPSPAAATLQPRRQGEVVGDKHQLKPAKTRKQMKKRVKKNLM